MPGALLLQRASGANKERARGKIARCFAAIAVQVRRPDLAYCYLPISLFRHHLPRSSAGSGCTPL